MKQPAKSTKLQVRYGRAARQQKAIVINTSDPKHAEFYQRLVRGGDFLSPEDSEAFLRWMEAGARTCCAPRATLKLAMAVKLVRQKKLRRRGGAMHGAPLGAVIQKSGGWYAAELPSFPGAYGQGRTKREAFLNLMSAVRDLTEAYADEAQGSRSAHR